MSGRWIAEYLQPGRRLVDVGAGVLSSVEPNAHGSRYDRQARTFDLLVGNRFYNRLVWRTSTASYAKFAAAAVAGADGPLLDVGCGTAVFTADSYRSTDRPLILVDCSVGMLTRAAKRRARADANRIAFVQADLFDLPFRSGAFATVACHGLLHLFADPDQVLRMLRSQLAPGGSLYVTSLVAETRIGTRMLRLLHRIGESAMPRQRRPLHARPRRAR